MHRTYKGIEAETKFCVKEVQDINEEQKRLDMRRQDLNEEEEKLNERRHEAQRKIKGHYGAH
jgi:chromosome segregation ATPase